MIGWQDELYGGIDAGRPRMDVRPASDASEVADRYFPRDRRPTVDMPPPPPPVEYAEIQYEPFEEAPDLDELPSMYGADVWDIYKDDRLRPSTIGRFGTREAVIDADLARRGYEQDPDSPDAERLDPIDIAVLAANAGFEGDDLIKIVAIGLAESHGGMPYVVGDKGINPETGEPYLDETYGPSVGIWQIRTVLKPPDKPGYIDYVRRYEDLFDPAYNARAAKHIYDKSAKKDDPFAEWTVYTSGKYLEYIDYARRAVELLEQSEFEPTEPEPFPDLSED